VPVLYVYDFYYIVMFTRLMNNTLACAVRFQVRLSTAAGYISLRLLASRYAASVIASAVLSRVVSSRLLLSSNMPCERSKLSDALSRCPNCCHDCNYFKPRLLPPLGGSGVSNG
jgi:hypothetical protein